MSRPVGSKNKSTIAKEKQSATAPVMTIDELEALRDAKYDEWESAPKGMAKAKLMNELEDIEEQLEAARNIAESSSGISSAEISRIVNDAVSKAISATLAENQKLINEMQSLLGINKSLVQKITELESRVGAQTSEIGSLKAEIASLKSSHNNQIAKLGKQMEVLQQTSDVVSAQVSKKQAATSVTRENGMITISVPKTRNKEEFYESIAKIANTEYNGIMKEQVDSALNNLDRAKNYPYRGLTWDDLDEDFQMQILRECPTDASNDVYDYLISNEDRIDKSIAKRNAEYEANTVSEPDGEDMTSDASDVEPINPDEFEEIFGG